MKIKPYIPKITTKEIEENHRIFSERRLLYEKRGLNFLKSREFIFKKAHPLGEKILEIGTGKGYAAMMLAEAGYKIISIDNNQESLKIVALNLAHRGLLSQVTFYVMDGTNLDFENEIFDSVVAVGLFHHIIKIDKMFSEINRVLKKDGKAVLVDFNKKGMGILDKVHSSEGNHHDDSGVTAKHVTDFFKKLNYKIKRFDDETHWVLIAEKNA